MRFRRRGRFHELVERQLDLFAARRGRPARGGGRGGGRVERRSGGRGRGGLRRLPARRRRDRRPAARHPRVVCADARRGRGGGVRGRVHAGGDEALPALRDPARRPRPATSEARRARRASRGPAVVDRQLVRVAAAAETARASGASTPRPPALLHERAAERVVGVVVDRRELEHLAELALGRRQSVIRKYAIPSASRIDAFSGSSRRAFSSGTVACAASPFAQPRPSELIQVVRLAHRPLIVPDAVSRRAGERSGEEAPDPPPRARAGPGEARATRPSSRRASSAAAAAPAAGP